MATDDFTRKFNDAISQQHDVAGQVLREAARVQEAKRAAESQKHHEQLDGMSTVAEVAARGLAEVVTVTDRVHQATEEVRDAAQSLADATDEVGGAVLLVNTSVGHVDQAVANMEVAMTGFGGFVRHHL
jgi:methyl-accepting chemotaxis protein